MSDDKFKDFDFDSEEDDIFGDDPFSDSADMEGASSDAGVAKAEEILNSNRKVEKPNLLSKDGVIDFVKENVIYIVGGVVVLCVGYYLLFGIIFAGAPTAAKPEPRPAHQSVGFGLTSSPVAVPRKVASHVARPTEANAIDLNRDELKSLVDGFSHVVDEKTQNIEKQLMLMQRSEVDLTKQEIVDMRKNSSSSKMLVAIGKQVASLNTQLHSYAKTMKVITKQLLKTQGELSLLLAQKEQTREHYMLRAVVPGRAWLVKPTGQTLSIAVGDSIPNYGKVKRINTSDDTVLMSSGYVFS